MSYDPNTSTLDYLLKYGHFDNPAKPEAMNVVSSDLKTLVFGDQPVIEALQSIQELDANLDPLCQKHHGRDSVADGEVGPATLELMSMDRCGHADFGPKAQYGGDCSDCIPEGVELGRRDATGNGYFPTPGCDISDPEKDNVHSVRFYVNRQGASNKQESYLDKCLSGVQHCCAESGLRVRLVDNKDEAELSIEFGRIRGSTIGWFYLPQSRTCDQHMSGKLDTDFNPDWFTFCTLIIHEALGHGIGHQHTRGGIMNPSILSTPKSAIGFPTYQNDGSRGNEAAKRMAKWFGDEPVSIEPGGGPTEPPVIIPFEEYWLEGTLQLMRGDEVVEGAEFYIRRKTSFRSPI